jgi:hypothetical protein
MNLIYIYSIFYYPTQSNVLVSFFGKLSLFQTMILIIVSHQWTPRINYQLLKKCSNSDLKTTSKFDH